MNELTNETIETIYHCRREIETAQKLLDELKKEEKRDPYDRREPTLKDSWGHRRNLQLGIPSSDTGRTLYSVPWTLAKYVIEAHIAAKQKELAEAHVRARMELDGVVPVSAEGKEAA
jgi:hypothetical protein